MARPQDLQRSFFPFRNPFRMILPKGSSLSPEMLELLKTFEENLAGRLRKLKPTGAEDVPCLSWMTSAVESLCELHGDIKNLVIALDIPACDWKEKWFDVYSHNSVKLMDICTAFNSEILRLKQSLLFLRCTLHDLDTGSVTKFLEARSSLDKWRQYFGSKNPKLDKAFSVMDSLVKMLELPEVKNSSKGKVLMRVLYGIKVVTLFVYCIFATAFSGSATKLMDLKVPDTFSWAEAFADLQTSVNSKIRNMPSNGNTTFLKELEVVETAAKGLYPIVQDGADDLVEDEVLQKLRLDLENSVENLYEGLGVLATEVDGFFEVVMRGSNAFLSILRLPGNDSDRVRGNARGQAVR